MKTNCRIAFALIAAAHLFLSFIDASLAEPPPLSKLGVILPLSGEAAIYGTPMRQGVELALANGAAKDFAVIFEDDRSLNKVASLKAARKLIDVDKVTVILNSMASNIAAIAPVLNSSKTTGIVMWDSNKAVAKLGEYVFGMGYSNELAGELLAEFTFNKLRREKIAVLSSQDEWAEVYSEAFLERYKLLGGKVVLRETVNPGESNFKSIIARVKSAKAEAMVGVLYTSALVSWVKQSAEQKFQGDLLTADAVSDYEIKELGPVSEGLYASQMWVTSKELANLYRAKFGELEGDLSLAFVSVGYDAVNCLAQLKRKIESLGGVFSAESVKATLPGFSCDAVTGRFTVSHDRLSDKREVIVQVRNGRFGLIE